mgnify:CR=1 FL=1
MNASNSFFRRARGVVASLTVLLGAVALAQAATPTGSVEVPDGAPVLGKQDAVVARGEGVRPREGAVAPLQIHEERVQGRLASAQVSVGGRSYLIVDPAAGRYDRQADNGGRRVTPVLWELFRF